MNGVQVNVYGYKMFMVLKCESYNVCTAIECVQL